MDIMFNFGKPWIFLSLNGALITLNEEENKILFNSMRKFYYRRETEEEIARNLVANEVIEDINKW